MTTARKLQYDASVCASRYFNSLMAGEDDKADQWYATRQRIRYDLAYLEGKLPPNYPVPSTIGECELRDIYYKGLLVLWPADHAASDVLIILADDIPSKHSA